MKQWCAHLKEFLLSYSNIKENGIMNWRQPVFTSACAKFTYFGKNPFTYFGKKPKFTYLKVAKSRNK